MRIINDVLFMALGCLIGKLLHMLLIAGVRMVRRWGDNAGSDEVK